MVEKAPPLSPKPGILMFLTGRLPKRTHGIILFSLIGYLLLSMLISQLLFPGYYSPFENMISDEGGLVNNPSGHWVFNIAAMVTGLLLVFHFIYFYRQIWPATKVLTVLSLLCALVGAVSFIFVGVFPQDNEAPHDMAADLAFGGLGLAAFFLMPVLFLKAWRERPVLSFFGILLLYAIVLGAAIGAAVVPNLDARASQSSIDPKWFNWAIWQWISFFAVMGWICCTFLLIPDKMSQKKAL